MSQSSNAIVLYAPVEPRLLPRTSGLYRAGIVMESLEVRRVLSAAACAVALPDEAPDDQAIVVDDSADAGDDVSADPTEFETCELFLDDGGDDGEAWDGDGWDGEDAGDGEVLVDEGDPDELDIFATEDDGADPVIDDGVAWPDGWGWSLDRLPTQDEIDAANGGDDLGGLWVPVRYFGGAADDGAVTTGDDDGIDPRVFVGGGTGGDLEDPHVIFYNMAGGGLGTPRTLERGPTAVAEKGDDAGGQPSGDGQARGGAPSPVTFGTGVTVDGLLLGKLKSSVTADEDRDLPFLN